MTINTIERNTSLCLDYLEGKEINEVARAYGLSERRVSQILQGKGIVRRPRPINQKAPLSQAHARVGLYLFHWRMRRDIEVGVAANDLGWSVIKLRKIERGVTNIELLDLLDIAAYTEMQIGDLLEKTHDPE